MNDTPAPAPALTDEQIDRWTTEILAYYDGPTVEFTEWLAAVVARAKREEREASGAQTIYVVQEWVDADGIHDGWNTAYGGFTNSLADAERTLEHLRKTHRDTEFRLATATRSRWKEVTDDETR